MLRYMELHQEKHSLVVLLEKDFVIFGNDSVLSVKIPGNTSDKIRISCDGDDSVELRPGDCVRVGKSKYYADFIRIKNESFIDVLNSKLAQRRA